MKRVKEYLKQNTVFAISVVIALFVIVGGFVFSDSLNTISGSMMAWISEKFGWLYIGFIVFLCGFMVWLALGKYGDIKLGKPLDKPEYSNFSWFAMLFCGGMGIGLVFWSIAEPLSHYVAPPNYAGVEPATPEAAAFSLRTCFLHWGIPLWSCYALVGLGIGFFQFRKGKSALISTLLSPLIGEKLTRRWPGKAVDVFAVVVSFCGVATSLGLGVVQICGGLEHLFQLPNNNITWLIIIVVITCVFLTSSISGVSKGIKLLSNINTYIAIALLIACFLIGPTLSVLNNTISSLGQHFQNFFGDIMAIDSGGDLWFADWRLFYFAWFIAWAPYTGMFIAKISKGRTIREFVVGVILAPTVFSIIWFAVFGTLALNVSGNWSLEELSAIIAKPEIAMFMVYDRYPLHEILSVMSIVLLTIFFITSADSATFSIGIMTSDGNMEPPLYKKVVWAIVVATIAYLLLLAGSIKPLQTISIASSLPFLVIMILICPALLKEFKREKSIDNQNGKEGSS